VKLEDQVCSLELAKRLKELGVKQESLYYWWELSGSGFLPLHDDRDELPCGDKKICSAFTVAELGEMLPDDTESYKDVRGWNCDRDNNLDGFISSSGGKTEAEARARMIIHLIENKLMEVPR
jgi:hypothetical protein